MPLPGLQIYLEISGQKEILQPILTPKVDRFMLLLKRPLVRICVEISHSLSKYVHEFGMDVRINGWKERQTDNPGREHVFAGHCVLAEA